jgi:TolB-like protein
MDRLSLPQRVEIQIRNQSLTQHVNATEPGARARLSPSNFLIEPAASDYGHEEPIYIMSGFFEELQRRKVYRVAAAYVIAAGFIIQIASATFPAWELPNWSLRLVIAFLLIGFPIALIFAWGYDLTPQGIQATPKIPGAHRRRNLVLLIVAAATLSIAAGFFLLPRVAARKLDKSVAVLPFQNLSSDPENAFFADGVQEDVITSLGKIAELRVISRTSVTPYRGTRSSVREIGKALGVGAILEGTVRRYGNRVRVTVQLIDAADDTHIWAQEYERDLTDVFAIQTDLAQRISQELQAKLSPEEQQRVTRKPTENGEAYLAFIEGRNLHNDLEDFSKLQKAEQLYERAAELDPKFALAFAYLSLLESWILHEHEPVAARREKARAMADRALALEPNLPDAHLALGFYYYYADQDYEAALREFEIAKRGLPNRYEVYLAIGAIQRRQGKWKESTENLEKSVSLNPNDSWPLQNLAFNYHVTRNYDVAIATLDRALAISPTRVLLALKGQAMLAARGDFSGFDQCLAALEKMPPGSEREAQIAEVQTYALFVQRKYRDAVRAAESANDEILGDNKRCLYVKYLVMGLAKKKLEDDGARAALIKAKAIAELAAHETVGALDGKWHVRLGEALALLGEKKAAIEQATRATEFLPESKDAFDGPDVAETAARVYAEVGQADRAIDILDHLLSIPSNMTVSLLKVQPYWDPIRQHPRFQALIDKHGS